MGEGVVIDRVPIAADKSTDQQQEGRLRLVEIGDQLIHHMERIAGFDHDLCLGVQRLLSRFRQIIHYRFQRLLCTHFLCTLYLVTLYISIGFKLPNVDRLYLFVSSRLHIQELPTYKIQRLQCPHTGGTYGNYLS